MINVKLSLVMTSTNESYVYLKKKGLACSSCVPIILHIYIIQSHGVYLFILNRIYLSINRNKNYPEIIVSLNIRITSC